jgi:hypothetical protein
MSEFTNNLAPAVVIATGLTSVACGSELWTRARAQREKGSDAAPRTYWYAFAAGFVGVVLTVTGVQLLRE